MTKGNKNKFFAYYWSSIFQLAFGSLISQIITMVVAPISTRLYSPEQLGIYTLIITIVSMFGPVLSGKYDMSIVSVQDENEVMELVVGSTMISVIFTILVSIGCEYFLITKEEIIKEIGIYRFLLIPLLLVNGFINIVNSYNNRYKEYKIMSNAYITRTTAQNVGLILFGLLDLGSVGLILSQFFGSLFGLKKQSKRLYNNRILLRRVKLKGVKKTLIKYKKQPLFSMPAHFINSASYSILNFFISGLFGINIFGYYSMSYRILGLPLNLVSMNVSKVFFQRASEEKAVKGNYNKTLKQMTLFLAFISITITLIIIVFGPFIFELVFGKGWYVSGVYARILAPMYGLRFIVSALTPALIVSGEQKLEVIIQSLFIAGSLFCYLLTRMFGFNINEFLTFISITFSIIYILFYFIIYKLSKKNVL